MKHPDYLSTKDFAKALGVHPETIRRWRRMGKLVPAVVTPGGQAMYARDQIKQFYHEDGKAIQTAAPDRTEEG